MLPNDRYPACHTLASSSTCQTTRLPSTVAERFDQAIAVRVVFQQLKPPGDLVVNGFNVSLGRATLGSRRCESDGRRTDQPAYRKNREVRMIASRVKQRMLEPVGSADAKKHSISSRNSARGPG